jgi:hypothetical protein
MLQSGLRRTVVVADLIIAEVSRVQRDGRVVSVSLIAVFAGTSMAGPKIQSMFAAEKNRERNRYSGSPRTNLNAAREE